MNHQFAHVLDVTHSRGDSSGRFYVIATTLLFLLMFPLIAHAQSTEEPAELPALTETYNGRGRLSDVTFNYPDGWFTVGGIPVNRLISLNVVSSVQIGIRNQVEPGEEAIVLAIAGGRIDRWRDIETGATPEAVLTVFIEALGDGDFNDQGREDAEFEVLTDELTFNGYDAVRMRYIELASPTATEEPDAEPEVDGDFTAYAILLDDNQFVAVLTLTSELTFEQAQPTIESILESITYEGE